MWITAFAFGWVVGCITLYGFLMRTAGEPDQSECMECRESQCAECPYADTSSHLLKRAA